MKEKKTTPVCCEEPNLEAIVCPTAQFEHASLYVVREKLHVDGAGAFVDRRRLPDHQAAVVDGGFCHQSHFIVTVCAVKNTILEMTL